jgi:glycosyltransferase involved in cell wall biosynthesis
LLDGIARQTIQEYEIILVDSGSTDQTLAIAANYPVKIVHILPAEFSFGYSLNRGLAVATGDLAVFASAHVYPVYPDWLERLLAPFSEPLIGLSYGKQRAPETALFSEQQIFAHWYPNQSSMDQSHPFCNNANAAIRRSLWEQQPYDETLTGLEDLAWAKWCMEQVNSIAYVAEAEVIHVHNETPRGVYNRYRREAMAFKRIFPHEKFTLLDFLRLSSINITSDLWNAFCQKARFSQIGGIFWFRWMQFWGTYQGYRHPGPVTTQLRRTFYYPLNQHGESVKSKREVEPIQYELP